MKSRKTRALTALGLAAVSGFLLMAISLADEPKEIRLDPTNAKQTIPVIRFRSDITDKNKYVELTNERTLLRIDTKEYNFVLRKGYSDATGRGSTILGGTNNYVDDGNYSTIIAGSGNQVNNSSYATIGGGKKNIVGGSYGTVAGGQDNTANSYSTVVGGNQNKALGDYSVSLGNQSEANGNGSVAMGKNAVVTKENSFLWADNGETLDSADTFAVVGGMGMVVNKNQAHRFAQLTIGGSIIINTGAADADVCNSTTVGVVKVVGGSHGQACFCSCNGSKRNSLYGGGDCSSKCDRSISPTCKYELIKDCSTSPYSYSGHCQIGEVVEGDGAYMVDNDVANGGKIHRTCQTNDGKTAHCSSVVTETIGTCTEPDPEGHCSGGYDTDKAEFVVGSNQGFTGIINATLYNRLSDVPSGTKCAWYCKDEYYKKGDICAPMEGCDEYDEGERHIPHLYHGETRTITNNAGTCTRSAVCENGITTLGGQSCYSCQGGYPSGVTRSTVAPTSNKNWACATDTTQACTYTCPTGQECNGTTGCKPITYSCQGSHPSSGVTLSTKAPTNNTTYWTCATDTTQACTYTCNGDNMKCNGSKTGCEETHDESYCGSEKNSCTNGGTATNTQATEGSDRYTWDCPDETGCYKLCPSGQTILGGLCNADSNGIRVRFKVVNNGGSNVWLDEVEVDDNCTFSRPQGQITDVINLPNGGSSVVSDYCDEYNCTCSNFVTNHKYTAKLKGRADFENTYTYTYATSEFYLSNGDNTVTLTIPPVGDTPKTYYITPSYASRNDHGEIDLKVTVDGVYTDLPEDLGLNIYWAGHDGQSPANGGFEAPGLVSPKSAGNYEGYAGYPIAQIQGTKVFTLYDIGFDSSYSKQTTKNGDTYIMNWNPVGPQCGSANGTNRDSAPSTNNERCANGNFDNNMNSSNTGWSWTCTKDGVTTSPVCLARKKPACGSDNGKTVTDMPTGTAACNPGYVKNGGGLNAEGTKYEWTCVNGAGQSNPCSANKATAKFNLSCGGGYTDIYFTIDSTPTTNKSTFYNGVTLGMYSEYKCNNSNEVKKVEFSKSYDGANRDSTNGKGKEDCGEGNYSVEYTEIRSISPDIYGGYKLSLGNSVSCGTSIFGYECLGTQPGDNTLPSSEAPTSNKPWDYVDTNASLEACKWTCVDGYKRYGETMNCYKCKSTLPEHAELWNNNVPSNNTTNYGYSSSSTSAACKFRCVNEGTDYRWNSSTSKCDPIYSCQGNLPEHAELWNNNEPSNGTTNYGYSQNSTSAACKFHCVNEGTDYRWNATAGTCDPIYSCQGTPPPDVTPSTVPPTNNTTYWTCATDTTQACTYTCNGDNMKCNGSKTGCEETHDESYCGSEKNSCTNGGTASNQTGTTSKWTWDCPDETGCYACKQGYTDELDGGCFKYCQGDFVPPDDEGTIKGPSKYIGMKPILETQWSYVDNTTDLDACKYTCAEGYHHVRSIKPSTFIPIGVDPDPILIDDSVITGTCVKDPDPECIGSFSNAHLVAGTDEGLTSSVNSKLYAKESDVPSGTKCAYVCNSDAKYLQDPNNASLYTCRTVDHYGWIYDNARRSTKFFSHRNSTRNKDDKHSYGAYVYGVYLTTSRLSNYTDKYSRNHDSGFLWSSSSIVGGFKETVTSSNRDMLYEIDYEDEDHYSFRSVNRQEWVQDFADNSWYRHVTGEENINNLLGSIASISNYKETYPSWVTLNLSPDYLPIASYGPSISARIDGDDIYVSFGTTTVNRRYPEDYKRYTEDSPLTIYANVIWGGVFSNRFGWLGGQKEMALVENSNVFEIEAYVKPYYYKQCPSGNVVGNYGTYSISSPGEHGDSVTETTWEDTCQYRATIICKDGTWKIDGYERNINPDQCNSTCFLSGTAVLTPDGSKNIEDIQVGDMVLSYNPKTNQNEYNRVNKKFVHEDVTDELYELMIDGNLLKTTRAHRFYVVKGEDEEYQCVRDEWVAAVNLKVGDTLRMSDGKYVKIDSIKHYPYHTTYYNLGVENVNNYYVGNGYLVHNSQFDEFLAKQDDQVKTQAYLPVYVDRI